ncbi:class II aldolase/adducin family protein [Rhodospirillaceae bacterium AH-315-P19]|nr:class II aldolase/adducin family protein [Rhodospirillaceae bacterium AH-315-P19]
MTDGETPNLRKAMVAICRAMVERGLNRGRSGNVSARCGEQFLMTPSGIDPADMGPGDLVLMDFDGRAHGPHEASSEWRFHRDILAACPEINVVLHAHPIFATALACLGRDIPAFHYMVAMAGGASIRCAPYATFGSQELSDHALAALADRRACLLANHGMIALGESLARALDLAVEVEALSEQYAQALAIGDPVILSDSEMATVLEKFRTYGAAGG